MEIKTNRANTANTVLKLGIVGICAVLLTIISDFILIGRPNSAYSFLKLGTESMGTLAQWRITLGTFIGVIVLPFQIAGLASVYQGLKPAGRIMPLIVVITNAHAIIMGVAFHVSYAFIGSGWKLYYEMGPNKITSQIVERFDFYWWIIVAIMFAELLFSSVVYVVIIIRRNTLFPKWMAILNPLCILIFIFPFILILPYPIGGFIGPACFNIATMVYLIFSTYIIYKKLNIQKL